MNNIPPTRMPTWFIPHGGGPCFFMDWNPIDAWDRMADFLKNASRSLPRQPKAIVLVSAHWLEPIVGITSGAHPSLIFDYHGFPPHTYKLTYPAAGAPDLAARIADLLQAQGIPAQQDAQRGFDHGVFIPLKLVFPHADIPVVQVSLHNSLDPVQHIKTAYGNPQYAPISDEFDDWLTHAVQAEAKAREQLLAEWTLAPRARDCHPLGAEEHLLPLMTVAGAAGNSVGRKVFSDRVMQTTLSAFTFSD